MRRGINGLALAKSHIPDLRYHIADLDLFRASDLDFNLSA